MEVESRLILLVQFSFWYCCLFLVLPFIVADETVRHTPIPERDYLFLPFTEFKKVIALGLEVQAKFTKELVDKDGKVHDPRLTSYEAAMEMSNCETTELWLVRLEAQEVKPELLWRRVTKQPRRWIDNEPRNHLIKIMDLRCDGEIIQFAWLRHKVTFERLKKVNGEWQETDTQTCESCSSFLSFSESGVYHLTKDKRGKPLVLLLRGDAIVEVDGLLEPRKQ